MSQLSATNSANSPSQHFEHYNNELDSTTLQEACPTWVRVEEWHGNVYSHLPRSDEALRESTRCLPPFRHQRKDCTCHRDIGDSVDFGSLHSDANAKRAQEIPENVTCFLTITLHNAHKDGPARTEKFMCSNPVRLRWLDRSSWCSVKDTMQGHVDCQDLRNARTYCRNARVRVLEWFPRTSEGVAGEFREVNSCVVDHERDWISTAAPMISRYCGRSKSSPFCLEIDSDFEWFTVEPYEYSQWRPYKIVIKKVLQQTALHNFKRNPYWSKKVLKKLFDETTIRSILDDHFTKRNKRRNRKRRRNREADESGKVWLNEVQRGDLTRWLRMDRYRILATVIKGDLDLDLVYKLMIEETELQNEYRRGNQQRGVSEADGRKQKSCEPKITDTQITHEVLKKFLDNDQLETFETHQRGFRAIDFCVPHEFEYTPLEKNQLVPVDFDLDEQVPDGKGGGGTVHKATIRSDFHNFPSNEKGEFAVKLLKGTTLDNASSEMKVWQLIAKEHHNHITTFLTSWSQDGHFYILSPLAKMNLEAFLRSEPQPDIFRDIEWILEQLDGIASGIQHIHNIGRSGLQSVKTGKKAPEGSTTESNREARKKQLDESRGTEAPVADCGYHHDLKPANILVFPQNVFKISDFGTAKIRQLVSSSAKVPPFYTNRLARGDDIYGGPDYEITAKGIGRPYDIWSFGCISLQILLWAFGQGKKELEEFEDERWEEKGDHCHCTEKPKKSQSHGGGDKSSHAAYDTDDEGCYQQFGNYWYQCKKAGRFHLKKCVKERLQWVKKETKKTEEGLLLYEVYKLVRSMLNVHPGARPQASVISDRLVTLRVRAKFWIRRRKEVLAEQAKQQEKEQQQKIAEANDTGRHNGVNGNDEHNEHSPQSLQIITDNFGYDVDMHRRLESDAGGTSRPSSPYPPRSPSIISTMPGSASRAESPNRSGDRQFIPIDPNHLQVPSMYYFNATQPPTSNSSPSVQPEEERPAKQRRLENPPSAVLENEATTATTSAQSPSDMLGTSPVQAPTSLTSVMVPTVQPSRELSADPRDVDDLQSDASLLQDLISRAKSAPSSVAYKPDLEPDPEPDVADKGC